MNIESIELVNVFFFYSCTETFLYSDQDRDLVVLFHSMIQTRTQVFLLDFGFFAHATIAHTERKSYIEKSQWTDTNHQVQYHSHAVHMNDKTTASWLFVSLFFVCYGCYYDYFEPADWAHSEIQNTKPYLYGSPCYTVRLPYFLLTYATYICVGSFVFQRANWFMWPVIRSTFV